jgi:serine protease Do
MTGRSSMAAAGIAAALIVAGYGVHTSATVPSTALAAAPQTAFAPSAQTSAALDPNIAALQNMFENIYATVSPSVVQIQVTSQTATGSRFGGTQVQQGLGSGFVWDTAGNIVTNNHVIDGATQISVMFSDGSIVPATLVAADPQSDLAVVKVNVAAGKLHPVTLADSSAVKVGELTIAIGNPFGEQNTMTTGIVSAVGRFMPTDVNATGPTYQIPDMIQTDAPINPGNSGGVLLDANGDVIGVTNSIESSAGSSSGVGFAIPTEVVKLVVPALLSSGQYSYPYLGLSGTDMTPDLAAAMNLDAGQRGALVADVTAGGPAATAGIKGSTNTVTINGQQTVAGGDVIVAINGQPVKTFNDIVAYLELQTKVGQKVTLTVLRSGKQVDVTVTLGARPTTPVVTNTSTNSGSQSNPFGGLPFGGNGRNGNNGNNGNPVNPFQSDPTPQGSSANPT